MRYKHSIIIIFAFFLSVCAVYGTPDNHISNNNPEKAWTRYAASIQLESLNTPPNKLVSKLEKDLNSERLRIIKVMLPNLIIFETNDDIEKAGKKIDNWVQKNLKSL